MFRNPIKKRKMRTKVESPLLVPTKRGILGVFLLKTYILQLIKKRLRSISKIADQ